MHQVDVTDAGCGIVISWHRTDSPMLAASFAYATQVLSS